MTAQDYYDRQNEQAVFREWFHKNILAYDKSSLSDAILVMPYGTSDIKYRDTPNKQVLHAMMRCQY